MSCSLFDYYVKSLLSSILLKNFIYTITGLVYWMRLAVFYASKSVKIMYVKHNLFFGGN